MHFGRILTRERVIITICLYEIRVNQAGSIRQISLPRQEILDAQIMRRP